MLNSSVFGPFNPLEPENIRGIFAANIYAAPIEIDAPVATVWEIMTDFDRYPEWNPLNRFFKLDSKAEPNHTVTFGPSWGPYDRGEGDPFADPDMTAHETITIFEENCCLAYADIRSYLKAERVQYISQLQNGKTRYHTYERTAGLISPIVRRKFGAKIIAGFTANGIALKKRAEARTVRD
ncbi:MAG: SRPBCC domain-containing protein [Chloroflexi bacterium]|nr:SRPBCC domain-containing protein [Chloroflexota bacterium]